jgi:hypothetical protein
LENDQNVYPLDRIRRYRVEVNRREVAGQLYRLSVILIEVSTVTAILGRGLKFMSRELGYDPPRRIRFPLD